MNPVSTALLRRPGCVGAGGGRRRLLVRPALDVRRSSVGSPPPRGCSVRWPGSRRCRAQRWSAHPAGAAAAGGCSRWPWTRWAAVFLTVSGAVGAVAAVYGIGYSPATASTVAAVQVGAAAVRRCRCCWFRSPASVVDVPAVLGADGADLAGAGARRTPAAGRQVRLGGPVVRGDDPSRVRRDPDRLLVLLAASAGGDSFAAILRTRDRPPTVADCVFVLCLVGFGSKAGIVPLHAWLPRAHPEAPSHVSALMSAAMVNLGVYGLVRVGFDLLGGGPRWWWLLVLALGAVSALYGILQAAGRHRPEAAAGVLDHREHGPGPASGSAPRAVRRRRATSPLAALALAAALLHVRQPRRVQDPAVPRRRVGAARHRHAATWTHLGGLRAGACRSRPPLFGLGALAASALPPGNGVRQRVAAAAGADPRPARRRGRRRDRDAARRGRGGADRGAGGGHVRQGVRGRVPRPAPQRRRRDGAREPADACSPAWGWPRWRAVGLASAPTLVLPALGRVAGGATGSATRRSTGAIDCELVGVAGSLSPLLMASPCWSPAGAGGGAAAAARRPAAPPGGAALGLRRAARSRAHGVHRDLVRRAAATGLRRRAAARAATSTSPTTGSRSYLVQPSRTGSGSPTGSSAGSTSRVLAAAAAWGRAGRAARRPGSVHRYLGYGFSALCALLIVLVVTAMTALGAGRRAVAAGAGRRGAGARCWSG